MNSFEKLTERFSHFPGIGKRQAKRFAYHIARLSPAEVQEFNTLFEDVASRMRRCSESCALFYTEDPDETRSPIAKDPSRDRSLVLIVEKDADLETIEKSGLYRGTYFVLGGSIPVLDQDPQQSIHVHELKEMIENRNDEIQEIILALSATPQGENTEQYMYTVLQPLQKLYGFTISRLGRGISTGTELEYSDPETLKNALSRRTQ